MTYAIFLGTLLGAFVAMEWVAWAAHKYLMHGPLWVLHRDHHRRTSGSRFQRNDAFFVVFAIPSWLAIMLGSMAGSIPWVGVGFGIAVYGVFYFLVHEVFIHRRMRFWKSTNSVYFTAVRRAHLVHHRHLEREHGECFGLLWVTTQQLREARDERARSTP